MPSYGLDIRRTLHKPPRRPSADWWVPTTANATKNNSLMCFPKHGVAQDNKFLVTHWMTDLSIDCSPSALTMGPWAREKGLYNTHSMVDKWDFFSAFHEFFMRVPGPLHERESNKGSAQDCSISNALMLSWGGSLVGNKVWAVCIYM
jgi:hypothetical protein